jgi:hypothetical protein
MNPQAVAQSAEIYDPAIQAIQTQVPAVQQLYNTLIQSLQAQQTNQAQGVVASADQRGVGRVGLAGDVNTQLAGATNLGAAQIGMQNAQNVGDLRGEVGRAMAGRGQATGEFNNSLTKQSIEQQANQLAMTDIERKAYLAQQSNQREFEIKQKQAATRAYSQASGLASDMDLEEFVSLTEASLNKKMGGDGNVSPETFKQALSLWTTKGLPVSEFINKYSKYINKSHIQDYFSQSQPQAAGPISNINQLRF